LAEPSVVDVPSGDRIVWRSDPRSLPADQVYGTRYAEVAVMVYVLAMQGKTVMTAAVTISVHPMALDLYVGLMPRITDKQPYEIQQFCFDYVRSDFAPTPEQDGISTATVLEVLAIEIRDRLIAESGLSESDADT